MPSVGGSVPAVISGFTFTTKTAAYTAAASEYVLANASSAAFTVTLPVSPSTGTVVGVKKTDSSANVVTVVGSGATTIDKDANCTLNAFDAAGVFVYDGSNWQIQATVALNGSAGSGVASTPLTLVSKSAAYTAVAGDYVLANAASAAFTVTLPTSPATGAVVGVRKVDLYNTSITVSSAASIDGNAVGTGYVLAAMNHAAEFTYDGSAWRTVRDALPVRGVPTIPLASASWYDNRVSAGTNSFTTWNVSQTFYLPCFLSRPMLVNAITLYVSTAGTSGSLARLGIYAMSPNTATPTSVLYDFGTVSVSTTGFRTITNTSNVIPSGWVFLAAAFNSVSAGQMLTVAGATPNGLPLATLGSTVAPTYWMGPNDASTNPAFVASPTGLTGYNGATPVIFYQTYTS